MNLKWTDGKPYERTRRMKQQEIQQNKDEEFSQQIEKSAHESSLNHDENTWEILNQHLSGEGFNPFLGQSNYVDDITKCDQFLKPVNTTADFEQK